MAIALISIGSNLGQRLEMVEQAVALIKAIPALRVQRRSRWLETSPVGGPAGQPPFLNGALLAETDLSPPILLETLLRIESQLGRQRQVRWGARTIDLDILLYEDQIVREPELRIPHPRMAFRYFNLAPSAEIAGDLVHPEIGWTIQALLDHLHRSDRYIALTGPLGVGQRDLLLGLAKICPVELISDPLDRPSQVSLATNLSGPNHRPAIELVRKRAECLQRKHFACIAPDRTLLSDFWLGETADPMDKALLAPRLVVLLNASWEYAEQRLNDLQISVEEQVWRAHREQVIQTARRLGQGPLLSVDAENPAAVQAEVAAAIEAMEPPA